MENNQETKTEEVKEESLEDIKAEIEELKAKQLEQQKEALKAQRDALKNEVEQYVFPSPSTPQVTFSNPDEEMKHKIHQTLYAIDNYAENHPQRKLFSIDDTYRGINVLEGLRAISNGKSFEEVFGIK